jgi:hypothetical protein
MSYICDIPKKFCNLRAKDGACELKRPCLPIVEQCEGCERIENGYCKAYTSPVVKWLHGVNCPMATHIETEEEKKNTLRIGQQKQKIKKHK